MPYVLAIDPDRRAKWLNAIGTPVVPVRSLELLPVDQRDLLYRHEADEFGEVEDCYLLDWHGMKVQQRSRMLAFYTAISDKPNEEVALELLLMDTVIPAVGTKAFKTKDELNAYLEANGYETI